MTAAAALVYPLHWLIALLPKVKPPSSSPQSPPTPRRSSRAALLSALAVLSTAGAPPWALAMWGAGCCDWGVASGLWVGLLAACLSLKSMSFAMQCWRHYHCGPACYSSGGGKLSHPPSDVHKRSGRAREGGRRQEEEGEEEEGRGWGRPSLPLTCGEFVLFLLAAPTLVGACLRRRDAPIYGYREGGVVGQKKESDKQTRQTKADR